MTGTRNLSAPHTPLVIILPVSACSHRMYAPGKAAFSHFSMPSKGVWGFAPCLSPALDLPHPNDGNAESVSSAHDAGSHFASQRMLAQSLRAGQTISVCRAQHLLRRAYPNSEAVWLVGPAHAADSWFDRKQMLFRLVPTLHRFSDPNDGIVKPISSSHDADSHFASQRMLAQNVCAGQGRLFALSPSQ